MQDLIKKVVWHLDVDSSQLNAVNGIKSSAVRRLKWNVSWVQNVVKQFGPYLHLLDLNNKVLYLVREDQYIVTYGLSIIYVYK